MKKISTDVAVIGSGPSGSSVAKYCAEKGLKVILIEKKTQLGYPSHCAGYVSKLVAKYFRIPKTCIQQRIKKMRTFFPNGNCITTEMHGFIVERGLFDKYLCMQAIEKGSDILVNTKAMQIRKNEVIAREIGKNREITIKTKYIVGADGSGSMVARFLGVRHRKFAKCAQYELCGILTEDPEIVETYFSMKYAPHAYAWIYPTGKTSAKVGLGVTKGNPFLYLSSFIESKKKLRNAKMLAVYKGLIPLSGLHEKICYKNILLVGDAAGVTDPISGAGILSGIITGKLAAKAIAEGNTEKYEKMVKKVFTKRLNRALQKREILEKIKSDEELEKFLPKLWIAFDEFWND